MVVSAGWGSLTEVDADGRPQVLTNSARIEHARQGRDALQAVQEALDEGTLMTDYTWRKIEILAQVAQAHFMAASLENVSIYFARDATTAPVAQGIVAPDPQGDER